MLDLRPEEADRTRRVVLVWRVYGPEPTALNRHSAARDQPDPTAQDDELFARGTNHFAVVASKVHDRLKVEAQA